MKDHLCLVCGVLAGITILHFIPFVLAAKSDSIGVTAGMSTPSTTSERSPKEKILHDCRREWRADREAMMKRDMTEDTYVEQCSVRDDVPAIPAEPGAGPATAPE